jgi:hypothetical protein
MYTVDSDGLILELVRDSAEDMLYFMKKKTWKM